jgi:hypothetical protein
MRYIAIKSAEEIFSWGGRSAGNLQFGIAARRVPPWIPAFARMTRGRISVAGSYSTLYPSRVIAGSRIGITGASCSR